MISITDLSVAGLPSMGSNFFSNAVSFCDYARDTSEMSIASCPCIERVRFQFRLHVWFDHNTCQYGSARVGTMPYLLCVLSKIEGHHSYNKKVSSILQESQEDDLLLMSIDTQYHDSFHRIDLQRNLS